MAKETKEGFRLLVRLGNVDIDGNKRLFCALNNVKGVSYSFANAVCAVSEIDKFRKVGELTEKEVDKLDDIIENPAKYNIPSWMFNRRKDYETGESRHLLAGDLDFAKSNDIRRMMKIKCYKGVRHSLGLPVRGQRTRGNFRRGAAIGVKRGKIKQGKV
jgi:small subunit ribosomal protein S13